MLHRPLGWLRSLLAIVVFLVPLLAKIPPGKAANYSDWAATLVGWCAAWAWSVVPASVVGAASAGYVRRRIVDPEAAETLQELLDHLHSLMFGVPDNGTRVTLFRFHRWSHSLKDWPWRPKNGGWLIAVKRSGEMHQDFKSRFLVTSDQETSQGIAGHAWCQEPDVYVENLPDVRHGKLKDRQVRIYARATHVTEQWVRDKKPRSRSFYALKLRNKRRKKWGVVVIDSEDAKLDQQKIAEVFKHTQRFLALYATRV